MQEWSETQHFIIYFDPTTMAIITEESENNGRHIRDWCNHVRGKPVCPRPGDIMVIAISRRS